MTAPVRIHLVIGRSPDGDFILNVGAAYPASDLVGLLCEMFAQFPQRRVYIAPLVLPAEPEG